MFWALYSLVLGGREREKKEKTLDNQFELILRVDIVTKILKYLTVHETINFLLISPQCCRVVSEAFYSSPKLNSSSLFPYLVALLHSQTLLPYAWLIRELNLTGDDFLFGDLKSFLSFCPNLISLKFKASTQLSSYLVSYLGQYCPFLEIFHAVRCTISDNFIISLIRTCKSIKDINVSYSDCSLSCLPLLVRECLELQVLEMRNVRESPAEMVSDFETEEYLLFEDSMKKWKNNSLRELNLSQTRLSDDMVGYAVRHCTNLEIINISNCHDISDAGINRISLHCPRLQHLDIGGCVLVTDLSLQYLSIHLNQLHNQNDCIPKYNSFGTNFKPKISKYCSLKYLNLSGCSNITLQGVHLLSTSCPKLETIVLDGCHKITDLIHSPSIVEDQSSHNSSFIDETLNDTSMVKRLSLSNSQFLKEFPIP